MFLVVWPQGMWDLSLLTRIEPTPPALEGEVLTTELPEEVPIEYLFVSYLIQLVDLVFFLPTTNTEIVGLFSKYSIRGLATINVNQKKKKKEREREKETFQFSLVREYFTDVMIYFLLLSYPKNWSLRRQSEERTRRTLELHEMKSSICR